MIRAWIRDAIEMSRVAEGEVTPRSVARTVLLCDSYHVMALNRVRELARRLHIPGLNRFLRLTQTAFFGVELGKNIELGQGVYLVHTLGTVIGGTSKVGNRVRFMGNNTVGSAKDDGCPIIEDDVLVGCGARILGPIRIGARAQIGANAVVVSDVPADAVAVGVPAVVRLVNERRPAGSRALPPEEALDANGIYSQTAGDSRRR